MKKLTYLLVVLVAFASCKKDDNKQKMFDPNATLTIHVKANKKSMQVNKNKSALNLTAREWVAKVDHMKFKTIRAGNQFLTRRFDANQKFDTVVKMYSRDIIYNGELVRDFLEAEYVTYHDIDDNIIGYTPKARLREFETKIRTAFAAQLYEDCYKYMDDMYLAGQCTKQEYEALTDEQK